MPYETPFRIALLLALVVFVTIRVTYRVKLHTPRRPLSASQDIPAIRLFLGVLGILGFGPPVWLINPNWLGAAAIGLPDWARWSGAGMAVAGLALLAWAHQTLGANFNTLLTLQTQHQLITTGPYRWVRHPMYSAIVLWELGVALITANALVVALPLAFALFFILRVAPEEAMMAKAFGDPYQSYRQRTGRFVPRLLP